MGFALMVDSKKAVLSPIRNNVCIKYLLIPWKTQHRPSFSPHISLLPRYLIHMRHSPWLQRVLCIFKKYPESSREWDCVPNIVLFDWNNSSERHSRLLIAYTLGSRRVYIHLLMHLYLACQVPTVCKGQNQAIFWQQGTQMPVSVVHFKGEIVSAIFLP